MSADVLVWWENEVRVRAEEARETLTLRDYAICRMAGEGASLRAIAAVAGLSHSGVRKIVHRG